MLIFINVIQLKQLILESNIGKRLIEAGETSAVTTYEFQDSFPDNIVLPIKAKQPAITSFDKITSITQLTPSLQNFINTLNAAVKSKKLTTGTIPITAEAASSTKATNLIPGGNSGDWNQLQVDYSYSNGASVTNQTLADRRAEGIEYIIKKFVKLPAEVKITKSGNGNGTRKYVKSSVPILTYNINSAKTTINNTKSGKAEIFDLSAQKYVVPDYTDTKISIAKCNSTIQANGSAGNPIAYRTKLETKTGIVSVNFDPAYIPDRFVITQYNTKTKTTKIIKDTGYVSVDPISAQVDFSNLLLQLNSKSQNGYTGTINPASSAIEVDLGNIPGMEYFIEIFAPLGPTVWQLTINCQVPTNSTISIPSQFANGNFKLFWNKDYTKLVSDTDATRTNDMAWQGEIKNNKLYTGSFYKFDNNGVLTNIDMYSNGNYTGRGQL